MEEQKDFCGIGVSFRQGEEIEVVMTDVEVLRRSVRDSLQWTGSLTLMPSSEKQGGTADDSSSASESRMGNFSTADMGMSPR